MIDGCVIVMYHYVHESGHSGLRALEAANFERQLDALAAQRSILDYDEFRRRAAEGTAALDGTALLTFDDGLADHYREIYPRLRARGLSGVFFVCSGPLERAELLNVHRVHLLLARLGAERLDEEVRVALAQAGHSGAARADRSGIYRYDAARDFDVKKALNYDIPYEVADEVLTRLFARLVGDEPRHAREHYMSEAMIREMAAGGMRIGGHTRRHRVLSRLDAAGQRHELSDLALLRDLSGREDVPFSYPFGHPHTYDATTLGLLDEMGYDSAFTVIRELERGRRDRFEIARLDTRDVYPFTAVV